LSVVIIIADAMVLAEIEHSEIFLEVKKSKW
jgi:hypothetical protein